MQDTLNLLTSNFRFQDVFDILVIAYIIYRVILFLRNTRAMMLVQGIAVLLLFSLVSYGLQLRAVSWTLVRVLSAVPVVVPIIFQNELRHFLEELGRGVGFASSMAVRSTDRNDEMFEHILRSVDSLSRDRTGALIVLERQTGLQEYINTGVPVEGIVTSQLLMNIFISNTPLHDGALIIRENRIAAAACYLPLSQNDRIAQELGTRHRAAIGLSELSDALVIVVSEETGTVSLAEGGKLTRYLDSKMLGELLRSRYVLSAPLPTGLRRWFSGGEKNND